MHFGSALLGFLCSFRGRTLQPLGVSERGALPSLALPTQAPVGVFCFLNHVRFIFRCHVGQGLSFVGGLYGLLYGTLESPQSWRAGEH